MHWFRFLLHEVYTHSPYPKAITLFVDRYFWDEWVWPEAYTLYFNVYLGKSSDWGVRTVHKILFPFSFPTQVSPFHVYLTSHLPKLLMASFPLAILGATLDSRIRSLLIPSTVFISLISCLGHKEWRFIVYVVPLFNVAAARGARWMLVVTLSFLHVCD
jgi:alpha-1,6-mannosyltransferase